jgi:hypothetical protein
MPTFISKHRNLRITRQSQVDVPMPNGTYHTTQKPVRYEFAPDGRLEVEEGVDILFDGPPKVDPETGELERDEYGRPVPTHQDALSWLRSHPLYNKVNVIGAFIEEGREPSRIPDPGPTVREIIAAMAQLDVETLARIAAEEQAAAWTRPAVDAALEEAFAQVRGAQEALRAVGPPEGAESAGTAENGAPEGLDDAPMAKLRDIGAGLGLSFPPGTSKEQAREQIRAAIPGQPEHADPYKKG